MVLCSENHDQYLMLVILKAMKLCPLQVNGYRKIEVRTLMFPIEIA